MPSLPARTLREISKALEGEINEFEVRRLQDIISRVLKPRRSVKLARARKSTKDQNAKTEWRAISFAVRMRSEGLCENPNCQRFAPLDPDHFLGGSGRRVSLQSVYTVWALCRRCHDAKGANKPGPAHWLAAFIAHCKLQVNKCFQAGDAPHAYGYQSAINIAQARLDSLRIQGRAS